MTYGLKWGKKVRKKEATRREACKIELRLTAVLPGMEERKLHRYFCLSTRERHVCHHKPLDRPTEGYISQHGRKQIISTGSELV